MKNFQLSLFGSLLFTFVLIAPAGSAYAQVPEAQFIGATGGGGAAASGRYLEKDVLELINKARKENGLAPLVWNAKAAEVAHKHSKDMGWKNYFNHRSPDGTMVNDRADSLGLQDWKMIGENIALVGGYSDPIDHVVKGWMLSPGHRKNILDDRWKETGIGIYITSEGNYYFTQVFIVKN